MNKILAGLLLMAILLLISIFIFIPAKLEIGKNEFIKGNAGAAVRILSDTTTWASWWPGENDSGQKLIAPFKYSIFRYELRHSYPNGAVITIGDNNKVTESNLTLIPVNRDSIMLVWKCTLPKNYSPLARIRNYRKAKNIRAEMAVILESLGHFLEKEENIYGISFEITMSQDSTLVMTKGKTGSYPSEKYIYGLITELKSYLREGGALETNPPMLDVKKINDHEFETMVAIPADKELPGKGSIFFSRFVPWKVLTAEVKGGVKTVTEALHQMDLYINDHRLTRMAISFQSLVTNRLKQPDSTQWITRIYTPVP